MLKPLRYSFACMLLILTFVAPKANAQVNPGLETGQPPFAGYDGGKVDNVNLQNGNLHIEIPIISVTQRGQKFTWKYVYNSPIWGASFGLEPTPTNPYAGVYGINTPSALGWQFEQPGSWTYYPQSTTFPTCSGPPPVKTYKLLSNFLVKDPNGTLHAFPLQVTAATCAGVVQPLTGIAPAMDGSGMVLDLTHSQIILKDGTKIIASGNYAFGYPIPPFTLQDANGNQTSVDTNGNFHDLFNRETVTTVQGPTVSFTTPLGVTTQAAYPQYTLYQFLDSNGTTQTFRVDYEAIDTESDIGSMVGIPNISGGPWVVPQKFTLPTGEAYVVAYNNNTPGQLASLTLPTGATISYTYQKAYWVQPGNPPHVPPNYAGRDGVISRTVSGSGFSYDWTYSLAIAGGNATVNGPTSTEIHTFTQPKLTVNSTFYTSPNFVESEVQYFSPGTTTNPLRTVQTNYVCDFYSWNSQCVNVRPTSVTTTLDNGTQTQVQTDIETFTISPANAYLATGTRLNPTERREYAYGPSAPGGLFRRTDYAYLHNNATNGATYVGLNIVNRVASSTVYNSSGTQVGQVTQEYDNYTLGISPSSAIQHSASFNGSYLTRGNVTATNRWRNTDGAILTTRYQFDDAGNRLSSTDPKSNKTSYDYTDSWVNSACAPASGQTKAYLTKITNALNQVTSSKFDSCTGLAASATDSNLETTTQTYDLIMRPLITVLPDGGQTTVAYNDSSLTAVHSSTFGNGSSAFTLDRYDSLGRRSEHDICEDATASCTSPIATKYSYDGANRVISKSNPCRTTPDPTCGTFQYEYDALNRETLVIPPDGSSTSNNVTTAYCGSAVLATDQTLRWIRTISDAFGRIVEVDEPNSTTATVTPCPVAGDPIIATTYSYDSLDNLTGVVQNGSRNRAFTFDSLGDMLTSSEPESGNETFTYDANGNVLTRQRPAPNQTSATTYATTTYAYDALNRVTSKSYTGGAITPNVTYTYDISSIDSLSNLKNTVGRRVKAASGTNVISYSDYDPLGRPADLWQCTAVNCGSSLWHATYIYDRLGNVTSFSNGVGITLTQAFSTTARLTQISSNLSDANHPATLLTVSPITGYWSAGEMHQALQGNGLTETWVYNNRHEPCRMDLNSSSTALTSCTAAVPSGSLLDFTYAFTDANGRNNGFTRSWNSVGQQTFNRSFTYDQVNRLSSMAGSGGTCTALTWTYDVWANRTDQTNTAGSGSTCAESHVSFTAQNRITATGISYDAPGNVVAQPLESYQFDDENRITTVTGTGGSATYVYNADGDRVQKTLQGVTTYYVLDSAGNVSAEVNAATGWQTAYVYGGKRLVAQYNGGTAGTTSFITPDYLGSTRLVTALNKTVTDSYDYQPYGERLLGGTATTHKFTGKQRDTETNLDDFGARYYSSTYGTFMTVDPSGQSANPRDPQTWNRYAYARDNPIGFVDPNGQWSTAVHEEIYDAALSSVLNEYDRWFIKMGSKEVDDDQSVAGSYKHGMTPALPGVPLEQSREMAEADAAAWVDSNIDKAVEAQLDYDDKHVIDTNDPLDSGNSPDALKYFGAAAHTVSDETSPEHVGFQVWAGVGVGSFGGLMMDPASIMAARHVITEKFYDGRYAKANKAEAEYEVALLWTLYQAKLEKAREKKKKEEEEKINKVKDCPSGKIIVVGMGNVTCQP
jgi:RHS repeat-associated protein